MKDFSRLEVPINKTAALVVNQKGCTKEGSIKSLSDQIEDIKTAIMATNNLIRSSPSRGAKRTLANRVTKFQKKLKKLKEQQKAINIKASASRQSLIIKEFKRRVSENEWKEIMAVVDDQLRRNNEVN